MTLITRARIGEYRALDEVCWLAITRGATRYSVPTRFAWASKRRRGAAFGRKMARQTVFVARRSSGPVGLMSVRADGYIDLAFIVPMARGQGLFRRLFAAVRRSHVGALHTHASLHAEPAFEAMGLRVSRREVVLRHGQRLQRAYMVLGAEPAVETSSAFSKKSSA